MDEDVSLCTPTLAVHCAYLITKYDFIFSYSYRSERETHFIRNYSFCTHTWDVSTYYYERPWIFAWAKRRAFSFWWINIQFWLQREKDREKDRVKIRFYDKIEIYIRFSLTSWTKGCDKGVSKKSNWKITTRCCMYIFNTDPLHEISLRSLPRKLL